MRDVKSSSELYTMLLNKAQELRVVKSGTVGNVRIIDEASEPRRPQRPNAPLVLAIAITLGVFGGVAGVFMRRALDQTTDDPDEIEASTGLPVYATIPHSAQQGTVPGAGHLLAAIDPGDIAIENLRSLRTSLKFALVESNNNVVAITGPAIGVGKSFVSSNLAHVIAAADTRVLLVDCDLRRGRLHRQLGLERKPGVSDVVSGSTDSASAIQPTTNPNLDLLATGRIPPNPAELLGSHAFAEFLAWASRHYGLVVLDTPPVLAVTDATVVARLAGVNLLVLRAGAHSLREIGLAARRFSNAGVHLHGVVLNDVQSVRGRYGKYGRDQRYEYRSLDE
jgi:tyrosine-protein kinase Etk/Wzc